MTEVDFAEELAKAISSVAKAVEKMAMKVAAVMSQIPFQEMAKYNRRKAHHYRLSERNRLHPKRKPKGGR